jgi:sugar phosphate isomerase/epimerase
MFRNLSPGAVGIRASFIEGMELAKGAGFEGVDLSVGEAARLAEEQSLEWVRDQVASRGLRLGGWGLPVSYRGDDAAFQESLAKLPKQAELAQALGCTRCMTWILPFSESLPYTENFQFHVTRLRPAAQVLREHGCSLGLEFIGPKTSRAGKPHEFIWDMRRMLELGEVIGTGNVGLLLDCWHWYTSGGIVPELLALQSQQVVYVHVNDAPAGLDRDEQIDNVRCLPGETGVIDIVGFLQALQTIGYDGPVTPEPFKKALESLPPSEAARVTGESMLQIWRAAGLP